MALENIFDMAEKGYQDTPEPQRDSTMTLPGAHLIQIGSGRKLGTPVWGIRQAWPSMEADWGHLSTRWKYTSYGLGPFPDDGIVPLGSLLVAIYVRELAATEPVPALRAVRSLILAPVIAFFKLDISRRLAVIAARTEPLVIQEMRGPTHKKRLRMSLVQKRQVVSRISGDSSAEAKAAAIQQHNDLASVVSASRINLYLEKTKHGISHVGLSRIYMIV